MRIANHWLTAAVIDISDLDMSAGAIALTNVRLPEPAFRRRVIGITSLCEAVRACAVARQAVTAANAEAWSKPQPVAWTPARRSDRRKTKPSRVIHLTGLYRTVGYDDQADRPGRIL